MKINRRMLNNMVSLRKATVASLHKDTNLDRRTIRHAYHGGHFVHRRTVLKLAVALGCSIHYIAK